MNNFALKLLIGSALVSATGVGAVCLSGGFSSSSAFQKKYPNSKFLKNTPENKQKWISKRESFKTKFSSEEAIKTAFKDKNMGDLSHFINGYDSNQSNLDNIEQFLKLWCSANESTDKEDLLSTIKEWCTEDV